MTKKWPDIAILILGLWLIIYPFIFPRNLEDNIFFYNSLIVGTLMSITAILAIIHHNAWKEWITVFLGSWLISSAYFFSTLAPNPNQTLEFSPLSKNMLIVGLLAMINVIFALYRQRAIRDLDKPPVN